MPKAALNSRYLNDDRKEVISAAVPGPSGILLIVQNTASGSGTMGLYVTADDKAVFGASTSGTGVFGYTSSGTGVNAVSESGIGVGATSLSGLPLKVDGESGTNLIEAYMPGELRFKVTSSGDVHADGSFYAGQDVSVSGLLRVGQYSSAPATCDATHDGAIALTSGYRLCVCKNGTGWVYTSDGTTPCSW